MAQVSERQEEKNVPGDKIRILRRMFSIPEKSTPILAIAQPEVELGVPGEGGRRLSVCIDRQIY